MEEKLVIILNEMAEYLSIAQMKKLQEVLLKNLAENEPQKAEISNAEYLQMFLDAKKIEGCSERTLQYYRVTVERMLQSITTPIRKICTEEIRSYLSGYQQINGCGNAQIFRHFVENCDKLFFHDGTLLFCVPSSCPGISPYLLILAEILLHQAVKQKLCFVQGLLYGNF